MTFVIVTIALSLISCNDMNTSVEFALDDTSKYVEFRTEITDSQYNNIVETICSSVTRSRRSTFQEISEEEAKQALTPFVNDGRVIKNQMLINQCDLQLSEAEVYTLNQMTDDQLAELSFTMHSLSSNYTNLVSDDYIDCLEYAIGITDFKQLVKSGIGFTGIKELTKGTEILMTATTAKQIIKGLAKRAWGYASVAIMIYDFSDCLKSKQKKK